MKSADFQHLPFYLTFFVKAGKINVVSYKIHTLQTKKVGSYGDILGT